MEPQDDIALIEQILAGRRELFAEIVRRYQQKVLSLAHSMLSPSQAEDAAQEIFLKIYGSLAGFKGRSSFSTWVYRISANHCLNLIAKKKRERSDSLDALIERGGEASAALRQESSPLQSLAARQMAEALLSRLSPEERLVLTLREMGGLNYRELAETLDISIDLVKVRLFRARKALLQAAGKIL